MTSSASKVEPTPRTDSISELRISCLFLVATYVIHFASVPFFFLYEDDYYHIGIPATQSLGWVWEQIKIVWQTWPQGRPGMFMTPALVGSLINVTGSVSAGYIPVFLIVAANGYLAYRLFRFRLPQTASLTGALFCLVGCADPHKILLTHTTLQFAITLNLIGLILYMNKRPVWAYLIAGCSLFYYEISFSIFACAELLSCLNGRINWKKLLLTWGAWLGVAGAVFAIRFLVGETRAVEATGDLGELARRISTNVTWGPLYGLQNSYVHPLKLIFNQVQLWPLIVCIFVLLSFSLIIKSGLRSRDNESPQINLPSSIGVFLLLVFVPYALQLKRTVFPGFMRPVSGYHLCLGLALGFGVTLLVAQSLRHSGRTRALYTVLFILGCASAYQNLLIQNDYARSARYQAFFWAEIQRTASDAEPGDVILIPNQQLLESEYILSNSWGISHAWLALFVQTGPLKDWANIPEVRPVTVFLVGNDWEKHIQSREDGYALQYPGYTPPGFHTGQIPLIGGHVIILETNFSEPFRRRLQPILTENSRIELKKPPIQGARILPYTKLSKYLFHNFIN